MIPRIRYAAFPMDTGGTALLSINGHNGSCHPAASIHASRIASCATSSEGKPHRKARCFVLWWKAFMPSTTCRSPSLRDHAFDGNAYRE